MTACAALLIPVSGADAGKGKRHGSFGAAKACKAERESLGADAFKAKYGNPARGGKGAMKRCVRTRVRAARATCKAERTALGAEAFRAKYGKPGTGKNARPRCLRAHTGDPVPAPAS